MNAWTTRCVVALVASCSAALAAAQDYPAGPIKMMVPATAGSGSDVIMRLVTEKMSVGLKQPFVIDNRAGASGAMAAEAVARAPADGYTLFACTSTTQVMLPLINSKLPYNVDRDFVSIGLLSKADNLVIVPANSPFKTIEELTSFARKNPGKLSYGTAGIGTTQHLAAELLQQQGGFEAVHVPYKGITLAEADVVSGRLDFVINNTAPALANVRAGKTRALLVTSTERSPELPDTPSSKEAGMPGFEVYGFVALCAPRNTPQAITDRLNAEMMKAVSLPEVRERLRKLGFDGKPTSPQEQTTYVRSEVVRWGDLIRAKGLKFE